ncbi:TPA: DUF2130 domain-containing protein [Patescibacteria group bacterium]|nr:DUF2130 domain-containing protein [Patescibacteria group bacterium]
MNTQLICPHCKKPIELTDALTQQLKDQVKDTLEREYKKELENAKAESNKKLLEEIQVLKEEREKKQRELEVAQKAELELRKEKNKLDEERRTFELEKQRQMDKERDVIRQKTLEEAQEKFHLREKELQQKLESTQKSLEDAQRKATQGSQQLQGEVQELDLELMFHQVFPQDMIEPVGKGVLGADIRHIVKSPMGTVCGTILWECKRTKQWSDGWVTKLKNDVLSDKANIPAIISEVLPEEAKSGIGLINGVWVASSKLAIPLATLLRKSLLDVAKQKKIKENQQSKAEDLYAYVTSHDFQHQVEAMIEIYQDMQNQIQKERVAFERSWKLREQQVNRLLSGVAGIYGSMQGIAGQSLPSIKQLEFSNTPEDRAE